MVAGIAAATLWFGGDEPKPEQRARFCSAELELRLLTVLPPGPDPASGLGHLGNLYRVTGRLDDADRVAAEMLAPPQYRDWFHDDTIHAGHTLRGRVAIARGDIDLAARELLASADVETTPVLGSFGPGMALALELLQHGKSDVVLEYLERCKRIWSWSRGRDELDGWIADLRSGNVPEFGFQCWR